MSVVKIQAIEKRCTSTKNSSVLISDSNLHFSIQHVKKADLPAFTKELFHDESEKTDKSPEETAFTCSDSRTSSDQTSLSSDKLLQNPFEPIFSLVDLDPDNRVVITSAIRGAITTFQTFEREPDDDMARSHSAKPSNITEDTKDTDRLDEIIDSDLIIMDITKSQEVIIQAWNVIRDLKQILTKEEEQVGQPEIAGFKTFILISSLMTWSKMPELLTELDFKLHEYYYGLRMSHEYFEPMYLIENELLKLGYRFRNKLRVLVVATGLVYGPDEEDLTPFLQLSTNEKIELPIFGTGQNYVPVIHSVDLIRLLQTIIHNFPLKYEFVFASEPEALTQNTLISILCKSFGYKAHSRFVDYKNCLIYDLSEEDVLKLSANLPLESSYLKLIDWRNQYQFSHSMPSIARRYYSTRRQFKPPCVILSGPPCQKVKNIGKHLSQLLKTEYLTPQTMTNFYLDHLGSKDLVQRKWSHFERSLNEFTSLPRGKGLIKILNRVFLLPGVQKNGYVLEGFPDTYKEAQLLEEILNRIANNDSHNFSDFNFDTNLLPDEYIVLLMNNEDILLEMDNLSDNKGNESAQMIMTLENFRSKLSDEHFITEFYDERKMRPKMFYTGEFDNELSCAQYIFRMIHKEKPTQLEENASKMCVSVPILLDMMDSNKEKYAAPLIQMTKHLVETNSDELRIDLDTALRSKRVNEADKEGIVRGKGDEEFEDKNISLGFETADRSPSAEFGSENDKVHYETGIFIDRASKATKGTEGNVSRCCLKSMKQAESNAGTKSEIKPPVSGKSKKRKSTHKENPSCKQKEKPVLVKDEISPIIDWISIGNKSLRGKVIGWCRKPPENSEISNSEESSFSVVSNSENNKPTSLSNGGQRQLNPLDVVHKSNPDLIRLNPIFKNSDIDMYKDWFLFLDQRDSTHHTIEVYHRDSLADETAFNLCTIKQKSSKEIVTKIIGKKDFKTQIEPKSIIKEKGEVQRLHKCCGRNQVTDQRLTEGKCSDYKITTYSLPEPEPPEFINVNALTEKKSDAWEDDPSEISLAYNLEPLSKVNFLNASSSTFGMAQLSAECNLPLDSSSNLDPFATRRMSEMSNSGKSILKVLSTHSATKKSLTSISRKVRFSASDDQWNVKTFEEKYSAWIDAHLEELKEDNILKLQDPCMKDNGSDNCTVYLYKNLQQQLTNDTRNDRLSSLMDPFSRHLQIINYREIQNYFERHWLHFRSNPPKLSLLPTSTMLQLERNYLNEAMRTLHRKAFETLCDQEYAPANPCLCNQEDWAGDGREGAKINQSISSLRVRSSIDIFEDSPESKDSIPTSSGPHQLGKPVYIDCKKTSSWDNVVDYNDENLTNNSTVSFWNQSDSG